MKPQVPIIAAVLVPLLALGPSCATAQRQQLRLAFIDGSDGASEEDQGVVEPLPAEPVNLSDAELAQGFRTLAQDPQLIAFFRQPEGSGLHLLPASYVLGDAFVPGYNQLCAARGQPTDCLSLLGDGAFDTDDRQRAAMSIAWHSVLSGVALELGRAVDPQRVYVMVTTAMVGFMAMLAFPDPITKIILAALTLAAVAYMGWDTIFGIRYGWKALQDSCKSATSFADLRAAGERFGTIIGEHVGRIIVMLVVAAMGASLGSFTARLAALPGFTRAAQFFQARCGFSFGAVTAGGVQAVTISASSAVVALTPGTAWAATNAMTEPGGGGTTPPKAPVGFRSFRAFKKAMGKAGPGKEWHHIVEQTDGNVGRLTPERIHSTENVIAMDKSLHDKIGPFYSSRRELITGSTFTVRKWLSTQSYEAQRAFGLKAIRNLADGTWN
jgi:hypothetical protein